MRTRNSGNLKAELEDSGKVNSVEKLKEYEGLKDWEKVVVFEVELEPSGYSFELLQSKYPTLEIDDVEINDDGKIAVILQVNEVLSR